MPWHELRAEHAIAIKSKLSETKAPSYVNKHLSAIKGVMGAAFDLGLLSGDDLMRIKRVKGAKGSRLLTGREVTSGERAAMFAACAEDVRPSGARDAAILATMYPGGLRRAEVAALTLEDLTDDGERIRIEFVGKGDKERKVYLDNGARDCLRDWLTVRGDDPGPLFYSGRKGGHLERGSGLTDQAIYAILDRRRKQAEVAALTPHDFRRTTAGDMLDAGNDLSAVASFLGHASPLTTARYDRRGDRSLQKAAASLHIAYRRRTLNV